jgi:hypothetical protein
VALPKVFTLADYKRALEKPVNRTAREGWHYLAGRGVPEDEIFKHVGLAFFELKPDQGMTLSQFVEKYRDTRLEARKVRAAGKLLEKCACQLESVILKCPDTMVSTRLPTTMRAVGVRLARYYPKASKTRQATVRRGRIHSDPLAPAAANLVRLFETAGAGFHKPEVRAFFKRAFFLEQRRARAAPWTLDEPPKKQFAWSIALLSVAGELAGRAINLSANGLRKFCEERSKLP